MDINELSGCEMEAMRGHAISVETCDHGSRIVGNLYTIDPQSRAVALLQYDSESLSSSDGYPTHLVIIPGDSIISIRGLNDDEAQHEAEDALHAELDTAKAREHISSLFFEANKHNDDDDSILEKRRIKIIEFLQSGQVAFKESVDSDGHKTIAIGAVRILSPYTTESVVSNNANAARKMVTRLKDVLAGSLNG